MVVITSPYEKERSHASSHDPQQEARVVALSTDTETAGCYSQRGNITQAVFELILQCDIYSIQGSFLSHS